MSAPAQSPLGAFVQSPLVARGQAGGFEAFYIAGSGTHSWNGAAWAEFGAGTASVGVRRLRYIDGILWMASDGVGEKFFWWDGFAWQPAGTSGLTVPGEDIISHNGVYYLATLNGLLTFDPVTWSYTGAFDGVPAADAIPVVYSDGFDLFAYRNAQSLQSTLMRYDFDTGAWVDHWSAFGSSFVQFVQYGAYVAGTLVVAHSQPGPDAVSVVDTVNGATLRTTAAYRPVLASDGNLQRGTSQANYIPAVRVSDSVGTFLETSAGFVEAATISSAALDEALGSAVGPDTLLMAGVFSTVEPGTILTESAAFHDRLLLTNSAAPGFADGDVMICGLVLSGLSVRPQIDPPTPNPITEPAPYSEQLTLGAGTATLWRLIEGPAGAAIDQMGLVTWDPSTATGSPHTFRAYASNSVGFDAVTWALTVNPAAGTDPPIIDQLPSASSPNLTVYSETLTTSQGALPITWEEVSATPPFEGGSGVTARDPSDSADYSGLPTTTGIRTITVRATNAYGSDEMTWQVTIT